MIPEKFWLFAEKGRNLKNLPCIDHVLFQHTKRVAYKDGHCWGQCLEWDDQDPSQIRGSLFGLPYHEHQRYTRSCAKLNEVVKDVENVFFKREFSALRIAHFVENVRLRGLSSMSLHE